MLVSLPQVHPQSILLGPSDDLEFKQVKRRG
jgi:hypothetical protein